MSSPIVLCFFALLTMITAQNLGNPGLLGSYPPCAVQCQVTINNRTVSPPTFLLSHPTHITAKQASNPCAFTSVNNVTCSCDIANRAATSGCQKVSCSATEYDTAETLGDQLCTPLYTNGTINPSAVSSAIASATAAAASAVAGKNSLNSNDYPPCATSCQQQYLPSSGCRTLANKTCVCNSAALVTGAGGCESRTCSPADLEKVRYLSFQLCAGVGGIGNASEVANQSVATQTGGTGAVGPSGGVVPFTGGAGTPGIEMGSWMVMLGAFVGLLVFA